MFRSALAFVAATVVVCATNCPVESTASAAVPAQAEAETGIVAADGHETPQPDIRIGGSCPGGECWSSTGSYCCCGTGQSCGSNGNACQCFNSGGTK
jgi:hypothetical protein